ncbi:Serine 3-dehydrogenase [Actinomyces bovis]|uniref:Serine 3-dehydrogenase n=1 Tax=Actinomyces bovis TaxID=1658 RepID=A0ABY1VKQ2_9ACTO|nr:SDR family oxidoreductase [Actinomyces bovis]SPT52680.1 Serine 3-dehydrogenase [Actinomyces bovis]VEG54604.1 Serine 3-dehydrogenase [Actinomyces israelii]
MTIDTAPTQTTSTPVLDSSGPGGTTPNSGRRALVTGASTGIGAATVRLLRSHGWQVVATARRTERLQALAAETGCQWVAADLQDQNDVDRLAAQVLADGPIDAVVNNAGGAIGVDPVAEGRPEDWLTMYERNALAALRITRAFLPGLRQRGGDVLFLTSTAAHGTYPGGAGYVAAKYAERVIAETLRLELVGEPVRIIEIAPGMVATEEFSLNRLGGDAKKAAAVYAGVEHPLVAEDVAECIVWALERPPHVNIDSMTVRPRAQASNTLIARS